MEEIKSLENKMNVLCERMGAIADKCFEVKGDKIIVHHSREYETLRAEMYDMFEDYKKKVEEWLIENCDVMPFEILDLIEPSINGKRLYKRIIIRTHPELRQSYKDFLKNSVLF